MSLDALVEMHFTDIPLCLFTDSYKVTHPFQYPDGIEKVKSSVIISLWHMQNSGHRLIKMKRTIE